MLNLKKVIALVCVFAMVLTTVAFGATYSDVAEDSAYYEAVETLNKLGIVTGYEDGTYKPEDGVTRAEMAALIARIQGYGETAKANANTAFTDVPADYWASGYIANAAGMGIINGYGDGTFGPEDPVLYEQAVKMIMATLGYTPFAEKNGGYPTGYLAAAQRYDVSLAVANAAVGQAANRGTIAQLLANAIDTPLMVQSKWNTNGEVEYEIADGKGDTDYKTLMSENLGYVKVRGVVEENPYINISGTFSKTIDTEADAKVRLDVKDTFDSINKDFKWKTTEAGITSYNGEDEFLVGDTDVADYIGRSVIIYVKKVADDYEVVSVAVDTNRNDELVIALGQYEDYDSSDKEIDYYKDGAKSLSHADVKDAVAIYNNEGMALADALGKIDKLNGGSITLIDNDDTNGYDVAIVKMAATGVVDEVSSKAVTLKNDADLATGSMNKINLNIDESKVVKFFKEGAEIEASELVEWDILSIYAENKNSNYIVADVVANQVVGTITSKKGSTTSFGGDAYKVGDAWYDVAKGAYDEGMDINEGGTFYIDEFGKIAAFVEDSALAGGAAANYAYVNGVAVDKDKFGAGNVWKVQMQLITADGVEVFDLKYNAEIDSTKLNIKNWADDDADPADGKFTTDDTGFDEEYDAYVTPLEGQVVQFVKSADYISTITTAGYKKTGADEANFVNGQISGNVKYDAENSRMIGTNGGYVEADALVFIKGSDATKCKLGTLADLADQNIYTSVASYKDKKADYANILVVDAAEVAAASTTDAIAVITEVGSATDDDGQTIQAIQYLQNGEPASAKTTPEAVVDDLTAGDIVKIKLGSEGVVTDIKVIWNFAETVRATKGLSAAIPTGADVDPAVGVDNTTGEAFFGGYVTSFAKNSKLAVIQGKEVKLTSAEHVYVIDPTGRELGIDTGAAGDFTYYEALYDGSAYVTIKDVEGKPIAALPGEIDVVTAQKYADHVYVRLYEDKVVDVVIVKGKELEIEDATVLAGVDTFDPSDLGGMMAATLGDYEYEIAGDVITVTGDANKITGWTAFNSSNVAEQDGYFVPVRFEYTGTKDIRFINGTKPEKSLNNVAGPFDLVTRLEVDGTNADDATVYIGGQKYTVTFDVTLLP